ncbi:MAG: hypothetical protein ACI4TM_06645 [Candidatus Cryptobacteroides sp.]
MEQYYRIVLELYKRALQGSLETEAIDAAQILLAKEITRVHISGDSDIELLQLSEDLSNLKFQTL